MDDINVDFDTKGDGDSDTKGDEEKEEFSIKSAGKLIKSSRRLIGKISHNNCSNPVSQTLDVMSSICDVAAVFEPTMGLIKEMLLLFKDLVNIWHGQFEEKTSKDQHFLTLMGIAINEGDLSAAGSGIHSLMEKMKAQIEDLIKKQKISQKTVETFTTEQQQQDMQDNGNAKKNNNWFAKQGKAMKEKLVDNQFMKNVLNITHLKKDKENWLKSCQIIYDTYKMVALSIRQHLQKCVDSINLVSGTLSLEPATKIANQIYQCIHLIYFRYIVYMVMACIFGDGPSVQDKGYLFENKDTIIHELNASNVKLLSQLKFLWKPTLENRIIVTLFYHNKTSFMAIQCLQYFDKTIVFSNPEHDLCVDWDHENVISPFFRLCSKKWPEDKHCIGVDKKFALESQSKNNNLALQRASNLEEMNAFGIYRIHLLYEDSYGTKLLNLYYDKKTPMATDYMTLSSIKDDQWKFIILKIYDETGEFYYISPYVHPTQYIYMRATLIGEVASYDAVENKPTEQSQWLYKPGTKSLQSFPFLRQ